MSQQTQDRRWVVHLQADDDGYPDHRGFEADVQQAMMESAAILLRLGGSIQSYVIRRQDEQTGLWFPVQAVFKWQSFVPGIRAQRPAAPPAPEPEVDLEPEGDVPAGPTIENRRALADLDEAGAVEDDDEPEGTLFEQGGEQRVATTAAETQELLRAGWTPVAVD